MNRTVNALLVLMLSVLLSACDAGKPSPAELNGTDITGAEFANTLALTDHTGKPRTLEDFKGKAVALFFGFTHCPEICPTTMADLAAALKLMGKDGEQVQVLFVTVDPERDTPEVLAQFVPSFNPNFIGLTGTPEEIAATAANFKIFYAKQAEPGSEHYNIDHSAGIYAFDKSGKVRVYLKYGQKPALIAHDLQQLLLM